MEIAIQLRNYAYYSESKLIYVNGIVLEKRITDSKNENYHGFQSVAKGQHISLKYLNKGQPKAILTTLLEDIALIFTITGIEHSKENSKNPTCKFLFDSAKPCEIFLGA